MQFKAHPKTEFDYVQLEGLFAPKLIRLRHQQVHPPGSDQATINEPGKNGPGDIKPGDIKPGDIKPGDSQPSNCQSSTRSIWDQIPAHALNVKPKSLYTPQDLIGLPHLDSLPGEAPFLRGPYASMYTQKPWTIRQYAGFGDADDTNRLFHLALNEGSQGLSIAFDLPTHRGYDSNHAHAAADVGMAGVAVDSVEDMKRLLANIALDTVSVSMTMSGAVLPVMAAFIVAAEEMGYAQATLSGTIQNDIIKEFMVRNTYIFAPEPSLRIACDVVEYIAQHMPRFNAMSISGYHFQEAGADPVLELALTLANGRHYAQAMQQRGMDIDRFCGQLSFFFGVGADFYLEIAKLRAARVLWCEIVQGLGATTEKAKTMRMHCQTSGWSLAAQEPANNIARTTVQAMSALFGGTQSLHTNAYDEAISLPGEEPARLARNTQMILQQETGLCDVIDPWAGSYMMESLTAEVMQEVRRLMAEIDAQGGMLAALHSGWVNARIQANAARVQAAIDTGEHVIVGAKQVLSPKISRQHTADYECSTTKQPQAANSIGGKLHSAEASSTSLLGADHHINSTALLQQQMQVLNKMKAARDELAVKRALKLLVESARNNAGNLLQLSIQAMRARATLGECTAALEEVWPRYRDQPQKVNGVYEACMQDNIAWQASCVAVQQLIATLGRKPRILIAKVGQDGHDRGAKLIAAALHDAGFEVHLLPLFQTTQHIVEQAGQLDVDIVGISSLAGAHQHLLPELVVKLAQGTNKFHASKARARKMHVVAGGIIPGEHGERLLAQGISAIFSPGQSIASIVNTLVALLKSAS